jgi:hypothetical protein
MTYNSTSLQVLFLAESNVNFLKQIYPQTQGTVPRELRLSWHDILQEFASQVAIKSPPPPLSLDYLSQLLDIGFLQEAQQRGIDIGKTPKAIVFA